MKDIQYVIPFLTAILLVQGIAFAQTTLDEDFENETGPVDNTGGPYLELLMQGDGFLNMTIEQQQDYTQKVTEFANSDIPYEEQRNSLLQELSKILLKINQTDDETELQVLQNQQNNVLAQLEELGIITEEKLDKDIQYYADKYESAKDRLNDTDGYTSLVLDVDYMAHTNNQSIQTKILSFFHALLQLGYQLFAQLERIVMS